ncbi:MAG: DUF1761 domain-containing protein [Candidatus Kerfeldbacteria bacterium]|nr:DUF1761 domain-containing protein [Candidatus Kerfeldbacteria bacterium]
MPSVTLNYWAILVATVAAMIIGYVWYAMPVFGRAWMRLIGKQEADLKTGRGPAMGVMVVMAFVKSYILVHFVSYANATTVTGGIVTGLWLWLGFVFTTIAATNVFAQRGWKLTFLDSGYHLVSLAVMGAILASWT